MKSHLASIASTAFGTTNPCRSIREYLKSYLSSNYWLGFGNKSCKSLETQPWPNQRQSFGSHPVTIMSSSFTYVSNIFNVILLYTKAPVVSYFLWRGHCHCASIKESTFVTRSWYKHTWKIMDCMVLTSKEYLGPDIWPKTL